MKIPSQNLTARIPAVYLQF